MDEKLSGYARVQAEFLSKINNEIQAPLNIMIAMADLLAEAPIPTEYRNYVQIQQKAGKTLLALVDNITTMSKIEQGDVTPDMVAFSLRLCLGEVVQLASSEAKDKGVDLSWHKDPEVPDQLIGDANRLGQILANLLNNAIKYTADGRVSVRAYLVSTSEDMATIKITVSDTGIGMTDERVRQIRQEVQDAAKQDYTVLDSGLGVGLTIVKRLTKLMSGALSVESVRNEGTTFSVTLPFQLDRSVDQKTRAPHDFVRTILVVDDEASILTLLKEFLAHLHVNVLTAGNGHDAIKIILSEPLDTIITDLRMPGMDGFELLAKLKKMRCDIPVIVMSGQVDREVAQSLELGQVKFFEKPILDQSAFFEAVQESVEKGYHSRLRAFQSERNYEFNPISLLVAEDAVDNQVLINAYLKNTPIVLTVVSNGRSAVEQVQKKRYDLIIMDLQMPIMDGYQAIAAIREWESIHTHPRTPIIALSAGTLAIDLAQDQAIDCDFSLRKPITKDALLRTISRAVGKEA